jgi:hypothetical protein
VGSHTFIILEQPSSWSTSRIRPSWPRSRVRLRLLLVGFPKYILVYSGPTSILLFVPMVHVSHSTPSLLIDGLTLAYKSTTRQRYTTYTQKNISTSHQYYYSFSSLHFFHSLWQAGCLRLFPSGIVLVPCCTPPL